MKYIKKPVVIDAVQWTGDNEIEIMYFVGQKLKVSKHPGRHHDIVPPEAVSIKIPTLEGLMTASKGDFIIKGVKGEFYPCKPDIFDLTYGTQEEMEYKEPNYSSVERLTILQEELGYVKGEISTVAMLGLVGEAGEVLMETHISVFNEKMQHIVGDVVRSCVDADQFKKEIRKDSSLGSITLEPVNEGKFDAELSDAFYYINILATNRGLTVLDLAQMAHDKVRAKQKAGGSSEDKKS